MPPGCTVTALVGENLTAFVETGSGPAQAS
jgi:hypothetical protein